MAPPDVHVDVTLPRMVSRIEIGDPAQQRSGISSQGVKGESIKY